MRFSWFWRLRSVSTSADDEAEETGAADEEAPKVAQRGIQTAGKIKWTSQDQKFLSALKITVDERPGALKPPARFRSDVYRQARSSR